MKFPKEIGVYNFHKKSRGSIILNLNKLKPEEAIFYEK